MKFPDTLMERKIKVGEGLETPLRLREFFILEYLRKQFIQSLKQGDRDGFLLNLQTIVKLQTVLPSNLCDQLKCLLDILTGNKLENDTVFLRKNKVVTKKEDVKETWEYEYNYFAQWIHLLAVHYHWDIETINNLDPNFAAYLIQEILVNDQFNKEWNYSLTELAYHYDENSKKSNYVPLQRPHWMMAEHTIKKERMLKSMLPQGVTVISGIETYNAIEYLEEK